MRALLLVLPLLVLAGVAEAGHGVAIVNQTGAAACLGGAFAGEGHAYRGNFTNISHVFLFNLTTTAGWNSSNVTSGDEIRVCGGLYDEPVKVNKTNVTLRANNTSFDVTVNSSLGTNHSIVIESDSVSVAWFVLQNATATGKAGIKAANFSNISNNRAIGNYYGIGISVNGNNTLTNNTVLNNSQYGIHVSASSNNTLFRNVATGNGDGIYVESSSGNNLSENAATGNNRSGINLSSSPNNTIQGNNASANNQSGISILSSAGNSISNNTVSWNLNEGMRLQGANNTTINATNLIFNNSWNGIRIESGSSGSNISSNQIWNNTVSNINISQSNATRISSNIINNSTTGILFDTSRDHVLRNNTLRNHTVHLNASATTNTTLNDSALDDSLDTAIRLLSASVLRVANSTLATSASLDFNVSGGSAATLVNVTYAPAMANVSDTSTLTRKWFLDVRVLTNESNPIPGALVNASNATGASAFAGAVTNSSGNITTQEVTEFVNRSNGSAMVNDTYTPYNLTANKTGYANNTSLIGVTGNNWTVLLLGNDTAAPSVTLNYPNATNVTYISRWTNPDLEVSINYTELSPANLSVNVTLNGTTVEANSTVCFGNASFPRPGNCTPSVMTSGQDQVLLVRFTPLNNSTAGYPEGFYNLTIALFDNSSNNATALNTTSNLSVVVDHTGPQLNLTFPSGSVNGTSRVNLTSGSTVFVNFTYNETFPANYTVNITNATHTIGVLLNSSPNSTGNASLAENKSIAIFANASDGIYNVSVQVCDKAKNCSNFTNTPHWLNGSVAVDNVAPNASKELPNRSVFTNNTKPMFAINFTDLGTGVNRSSLNMTVLYTNGSLTLGSLDVGCTKRVVAPIESTIGTGVCGPLQAGALSTNAIGNGFGAVVAFVGVGGLDEIANNTRVFISANATDYMRNTTPFSWNFTVDTGSPRFENLLPANNSTTGDPTPRISVDLTDHPAGPNRSTVLIRVQNNTSLWMATCDSDPANVTCSESGGVLRIIYEFNQTLGDGSQVNITVNASDLAGNFNSTNFSINWTFRVNNDFPYAVNESPNHTSFTNKTSPSIRVIVKDDGGNLGGCPIASAILKVNGTQVCPSGGSWSAGGCAQEACGVSSTILNFTPSWSFAAGEKVNVEVNITDTAGNGMAPNFTWSFTVDSAAPAVSSFSPVNWTNLSNPTVSVNLNDTLSGLNQGTVNMTVNVTNSTGTWVAKVASNNSSTGPNITVDYGKLAGLAAGTNVTVNVTASDNASNAMGAFSWTFRVDLNTSAGRPNITITSPANGTFTGGSPVLTFTPVDDLAQTVACWRRLDGGSMALLGAALPNSTPASNATTLQGLSGGAHNASVTCDDQAGNRNNSSLVTWTADVTPPVTTDNAPSATQTSDVTVTLTATDTGGSGVASTAYCLDIDGTADCFPPDTLGTSVSVTCAAGSSCTGRYVRYRSTDNVGNVEGIKTSGEIKIDKTTSSGGGQTGGGQQSGGAPPSCSELWTCTDWSTCSGGTQTRTCTDARACGTTGSKPAVTATCIAATATPTPVTVTALPPPPPPAAAPAPAAGSSSSASAPEKKTVTSLAKGATTDIKFSGLGLQLEGLKDLKNVEVTYAPLDRRPAGAPFPGGDAYRYFEAEAKGLSTGDARVTFTFTVERSWLTQVKASEGAIRLLRLPQGAKEWQTLQTQAGKGDSTKVEFTARSEGFSVFAVAATGSAPSGGFPLWVVPVVIVLFAVVLVSRSQRMAPFWWRMRVRFRR